MLCVLFQANSLYFGAARTTPRTSRPAAMGSSLKATDRALEALDLPEDLIDGIELLGCVTDRVLPLDGIGELLGWVWPGNRADRFGLGAGGEKGSGAGQGDRVISQRRCPPAPRTV